MKTNQLFSLLILSVLVFSLLAGSLEGRKAEGSINTVKSEPASHAAQKSGDFNQRSQADGVSAQSSPFATSSLISLQDERNETGTLNVSSTPSQASVYVDNIYRGLTPYTGTYLTGQHQLKLTKMGYQDYLTLFNINAGQLTVINATLIPFQNQSNTTNGTLYVSSSPSGANVYVDNSYRGLTSLYVYQLPPGSHLLKLTKSGYLDYLTIFNITANQTTYINAILTQNGTNQTQNGTLNVSSNPSGASVYVDSIMKGYTPYSGTIAAGNHTLLLTKAGYQNYQTPVTINAGQITVINATLMPLPNVSNGNLTVYSTPSYANVYVDSIYRGHTPLNVLVLSVGNHTLLLTKWGYNNYQTPFTIIGGQITIINAVLTYQNASNQTGNLQVSSTPTLANVYLDNLLLGTTPLYYAGIPVGTHTLKLTSPGYYDYIMPIQINPLTTDIFANLTPIHTNTTNGTFLVNSTPPEASVYIDGIYRGLTPYGTILSSGPHTLKLTKTGYKNHLQTFLVYPNQLTSTNVTLTVSSGANLSNGTFNTNTIPSGASVYIDGIFKGYTPYTTSIASGWHTLNLTKTGYKNHDAIFSVYPNQQTQINVTMILLNQTGTLNISSTPSEANIYVDNVYRGQTPSSISNLRLGWHTLNLTRTGYQDYVALFNINLNQTTVINATLAPL